MIVKLKNENVIEKQRSVEDSLRKNSMLPVDELFKKFETSNEGVSIVEVEERIEKYGKNTIEVKNNHTFINRLIEAVINPFNVVLIIVAIITFVTDVVISTKKDYTTFILLITIVLISTIISLKEQVKSDNAAKKLKKMISNKMEVIRDGLQSTIDVENIVPGDIVKLSSGDMIPGDVRFLETKDLFIDQASLTGESNPVEKFAKKIIGIITSINFISNFDIESIPFSKLFFSLTLYKDLAILPKYVLLPVARTIAMLLPLTILVPINPIFL